MTFSAVPASGNGGLGTGIPMRMGAAGAGASQTWTWQDVLHNQVEWEKVPGVPQLGTGAQSEGKSLSSGRETG